MYVLDIWVMSITECVNFSYMNEGKESPDSVLNYDKCTLHGIEYCNRFVRIS